MLLHLILMLLEQSRRAKASGQLRTPGVRYRHIDADPVVVECPHCAELSVASHQFIEEFSSDADTPGWQRVNETYRCGACNHLLEAGYFENDGTGVLREVRWQCTHCAAFNSARHPICTHCRAWRNAASA